MTECTYMLTNIHTHTHTHTHTYMKAFLKNTNPQLLLFFLQSSRCVSNEQPCLKTTGLYGDLLLLSSVFHFFYFTFSAPISFSLFSNFSVSVFFSFDVLSHAFTKRSGRFMLMYGKTNTIL